jgi:hypothetical protein
MSYEAAILSAGRDDSVLVKSFIIAADEVAAQWYSLLSPRVIHGWDDLKQRILSNFQGFQRPEFTEATSFRANRRTRNLSKTISGDLYISEPRRQMFCTPSPSTLQSWVREPASSARTSCVKGPKLSCAYTKNSRIIVAQIMTSGCAWKNNPSRKSLRKLINPARRNGTIPEMPRTPFLRAFSVLTVKTPGKTPIRKLIHRAWSLTRLVPLTPIKGEAAGAEGEEAEVGVEAGAEATTRKENGIVFSTRKR